MRQAGVLLPCAGQAHARTWLHAKRHAADDSTVTGMPLEHPTLQDRRLRGFVMTCLTWAALLVVLGLYTARRLRPVSSSVGFALTRASVFATGVTAITTRLPSLTLVVGSGAVVVTSDTEDAADKSAKESAGWIYDQVAAFLKDQS